MFAVDMACCAAPAGLAVASWALASAASKTSLALRSARLVIHFVYLYARALTGVLLDETIADIDLAMYRGATLLLLFTTIGLPQQVVVTVLCSANLAVLSYPDYFCSFSRWCAPATASAYGIWIIDDRNSNLAFVLSLTAVTSLGMILTMKRYAAPAASLHLLPTCAVAAAGASPQLVSGVFLSTDVLMWLAAFSVAPAKKINRTLN